MLQLKKNSNVRKPLTTTLILSTIFLLTGCKPSNETSNVTSSSSPTARPAGSALGKLVENFPTNRIPIPTNATIRSSSLETEDQKIIFSITAETEDNTSEIINFYTNKFEQEGFTILTNNENTNPEETTSLVFIKENNQNLINLSIVTKEGKQIFSINGHLQN